MLINRKSIISAVAAGTLLMSAFAQTALAANVTEISGNGAHSNNTATSTNDSTTTVEQSNSAYISNNISTNANTGGNDSNANTGGSVTIATGAAATGVNVSNSANQNQVSLPCNCLTSGGNSQALISGNGAGSDNFAALSSNSDTSLFQNNSADFNNWVSTSANTGNNDANANTGSVNGGGSGVTIRTGDTLSQVGISNAANSNKANLGGSGAGLGTGNSLSAGILGNGADSYNTAALDNNKSVLVTQSNDAYFDNWVTNSSNTGYNDANANTGGSVVVATGRANSGVAVDNLANFNQADISCGCVVGNSGASILLSGNGASSDSFGNSSANNDLSLFQNNPFADFSNNVDGGATTGSNDSNANTGSIWGGGSFTTTTGGTTSVVGVSSAANSNIIGQSTVVPLGGLQFGVHWNTNDLWNFFHLI